MPEPSAPVAEPEAQTQDNATEPAQEKPPSLGTLADAFQANPGALKERSPRGRATSEAGSEESAEPVGTGEASKPDPTTGATSRRGAAAKIADQQAEIDRLVAEGVESKRQKDEADARAAGLVKQQDEARSAALGRLGDDAEFARLSTARQKRQPLAYDEDERLDQMIAAREEASTWWELAERGYKAERGREAISVLNEHPYLDKETVLTGSYAEALRHAVAETEKRVKAASAETEKRVKAASAERIAELETELKGLRGREAARAPQPTRGGASAPAGSDAPGDGASPTDWFASGIRAGTHRRNGAAPTARR